MSRIGWGLVSTEKIGTVERVADGIAQLHAFANVGIVHGGGRALVVDTSGPMFAGRAAAALRETTDEPLAAMVYTHGHVDHVGGAPAFLAGAAERGEPRPAVWGHAGVNERFERYRLTWAWNNEVNRRQFRLPSGVDAFPRSFVEPDHTYLDTARFELAGEPVELNHARGETDDATWVWLPARRAALVGDLSIQSIPNAGNPNKPQRYTLGWARALEAIAARRPALLVPGHGDPLRGADAIAAVLGDTARALRFLHDAVVERLNGGQWPDEIVEAGIELPPDLAAKPYLEPIYGCAAFVVRDVLRFYGGWWGGNPAELLPAPRSDVARDFVSLAGRDPALARARALGDAGEHRRALHLAVVVAQADAADREARELVADLCDALADREPAFIARSFYRVAAAKAREIEG